MTIDSIKKISNKYREHLIKSGVSIDTMYLFGSYATGKYNKDSDIDVCIVSEGFGVDRQSERINLMKLRENIDDRIEPHPLSKEDFSNDWDPFVREIKKYGIKV